MWYNLYTSSTAGAIILKICYGYSVAKEGNDPLVVLAGQTMEEFSLAFRPGVFMVDFIPWRRCLFQPTWTTNSPRLSIYQVKYIPSWFPGANFRKLAAAWRSNVEHMAESSLDFTMDQIVVTRLTINSDIQAKFYSKSPKGQLTCLLYRTISQEHTPRNRNHWQNGQRFRCMRVIQTFECPHCLSNFSIGLPWIQVELTLWTLNEIRCN
jgi:hypothetical protein